MYKFYTKKPFLPFRYLKKISLSMKLTILLLIAIFTQVSANSFAQRISLRETNTPLTKVFRKISDQTGYDFFVTGSMIKSAKPVTINVVNAELNDVLVAIFKNQPVSFTITEKTIVVAPKKQPDQVIKGTADIALQGTVTDEKGQPLGGATVRVLNTILYSYTDDRGRYNLPSIQPTDSILVSFLGYRSQTIGVNNRTEINIALQISISSLAEVNVSVSTGYQVLSKERATGSFGKPDMQVFSERSGSNDIVSRLEGLVPGLTVFPGPTRAIPNRSGNLGSQQQSLIRGTTTIQVAQQPTYIVNGVKVPELSSINPNDIADITVLKDAAALAIYGANAANGVIVITTKSGSAGRIKFNYSGNFNFQGKPDFDYVSGHQLSSRQFIQTAREIFNPSIYPLASLSHGYIAPHETILYNQAAGTITATQADASLDSLANIDNTNQIRDLWYRDAYTMNHTVSASGGNPTYNFYSSLSYLDNHSNQIGASNKSYLVNLSQNITPNQWLRITLNAALNNTVAKSAKPISIGAGFLPYQLFQDANGNNILLNYAQGLSPATRANYQARGRINLDYSPLDEIYSGFSKTNNLNINTSAGLGVKIWNGLSFEGLYGYQKAPGTRATYDDSSLYASRIQALAFTIAPTEASVPVYHLPITGGRYQTDNFDQRNWTLRNQLIYNTSLFKDKDRLNIQIGQEAQEQLNIRNSTVVRGYDRNLQTYTLLNYAALNQGVFGGVSSGYAVLPERPYAEAEDLTRFTSYFGLLNYSFNQKYDFDASIRTDHSNLFAVDVSGQKKPTSSFGFKWQVAKENFMKNVNWVNNLGLRVTYGITGNSPFAGRSATVDILEVETNDVNGNALAISTPPNRKLSFEKTQNYNFGVDFSLFNYRLSGNVDLYKKNTTDLLGRRIINPLNGFESTTGNLGNLTNKGIEVSLRSSNIQGSDLKWTTNLVFSYNKNKLVSYEEPLAYMLSASNRISTLYEVGYSSPPLFAYRYAGLDSQGDPQIKLADGTITKEPYNAKAEDLVYMGTTTPKFNGGLSNHIQYKNLSMTVNLIYNLGGVMRRNVNSFYTNRLTGTAASFTSGNISNEFLDRWKVPGDEARTNIPSYEPNEGDHYRRNPQYYTFADINVVSSSYIKLRDITLAYDISPRLLSKLRIQAFRLFVQSGNYMIWKANKYDMDPEYGGGDGGSRYLPPFKHNYVVGLSASF